MSLLEKHFNSLNWPDKKKSLFSTGKDWWNLARIDITDLDEGLTIYTDAYKNAADILVDYTKEDKTSINFLVFPIIFLYRHYIELALKELIYTASKYLDDTQHSFNSHNLLNLWKTTKKLISELVKIIDDFDIPEDEIIAVENQIKQFDSLDKCSMTFRYPVDKNGNVFKNLSDYINIENVRQIMDGLYSWFYGLVCFISEYQELKNQL